MGILAIPYPNIDPVAINLGPLAIKDGNLLVSDAPGLGEDVDWDHVERSALAKV